MTAVGKEEISLNRLAYLVANRVEHQREVEKLYSECTAQAMGSDWRNGFRPSEVASVHGAAGPIALSAAGIAATYLHYLHHLLLLLSLTALELLGSASFGRPRSLPSPPGPSTRRSGLAAEARPPPQLSSQCRSSAPLISRSGFS